MDKNLAFRCFVYELLAKRFSSVMESVKWIHFHGLEQRLAAFLIDEHECSGETHIRVTHECIAQHVGASRERVTKMLAQLSGRVLVTKANRCIEIIDIKGLREAAENTSQNSQAKIIEDGNYDELINANGFFADLVSRQKA